MKKHVLLVLALAFGFKVKAQTYSHFPVPVTGFTADVIADGTGPAANSTSADVDGEGYNLVAQNFVNPSNQSPTTYLPTGGLISSLATPGLNYQLQPYAANNSLRLTTTTNTGSLTLTTPRTCDKINLLITTAYGCSFTATVNFSDGSTEAFPITGVPNWFDGNVTIAAKTISRVIRATNVIENPANNPRLYQYTLNLSAANTSKTIQSIAFAKTTTGVKEILHIFAVSASSVLPNDIGITAITSPVSPVAPTVSQPVMVTVKNFGSSPLTSATLGFSVDGTTVVNNFAFTASPALATNAVSAPVTIGNFLFPAGTHSIKAWTLQPNNVTDGNKFNDTVSISVISCIALSGNYTIDKNSPASATSYQSFGSALQAMTSCGITGPVTFNVAPSTGPYNEQIILPAITGTSATNTITFNGNGNALINLTASGDVIRLNGAKYIRFNNLKAEAGNSTAPGTIVTLANSAQNNIFTGCTFTHSPSTTTSTAYAVSVATGSSSNTFQNNTITGGYCSIYNNGASTTQNTNNQFIGNTLKDPYYYGIYNYYAPGTLIEGNDISRPNRANATTLYGIYNSTGGTGVIISKNRIHNTHDAATSTNGTVYGIYSGVAGAAGSENIIKNNAIYNVNNNGGVFYALYNSTGNYTYYYHNTVSADNASINYNTLRGMYFLSASTNVKFNNNIISFSSPATTKHAIYLGSTTISLVSNNNNLFTGTSGNVGYYAANKATLADWKTVNSNAYDQASVSVDPQYAGIATGNLNPTNVVIDNVGIPVTPAVTDDITGIVRSTTTPDPGAFEFSVSTTDVGVTAVSGPASGCGLSANETITITVRNYGSTPQSNIPVTFTLNGITIGTGAIPGPLAPNATVTFTFPTKANLSTSGLFTIVASTGLTGDTNASNNNTTINVTNSMLTYFPVNLDFETPATGIGATQMVTKPKSAITEGTGASFGTGTKGMIMDGIDNPGWITPVGVNNPWANNPDNFSAVYVCVNPAGGTATDSLWLTFDLKQLYKTTNANTNFRVTVNGVQIGNTYNPPFAGTPISWKKLKVDLTSYKNNPSIKIGLESSVKEAYAAGAGTANLIDNLQIKRRIINGVKGDLLQAQIHVFPNPGNGQFNINLPAGKAYQLEVTDLSGKVIRMQQAHGSTQLNMEGTANGIYLLKVNSEENTTIKKIVIE